MPIRQLEPSDNWADTVLTTSAKEVIISSTLFLVCLFAGLRKNYSTEFSQNSVERWQISRVSISAKNSAPWRLNWGSGWQIMRKTFLSPVVYPFICPAVVLNWPRMLHLLIDATSWTLWTIKPATSTVESRCYVVGMLIIDFTSFIQKFKYSS